MWHSIYFIWFEVGELRYLSASRNFSWNLQFKFVHLRIWKNSSYMCFKKVLDKCMRVLGLWDSDQFCQVLYSHNSWYHFHRLVVKCPVGISEFIIRLALFTDVFISVAFFHQTLHIMCHLSSHHTNTLKAKICNSVATLHRVAVWLVCSWPSCNKFIKVMVDKNCYQCFLHLQMSHASVTTPVSIKI